MRKTFGEAEANQPSIILKDEIDSLSPKRYKINVKVERIFVDKLHTLMDGVKSRGKLVYIGATNRPNNIDPSLRRFERFYTEIKIGKNDSKNFKKILLDFRKVVN